MWKVKKTFVIAFIIWLIPFLFRVLIVDFPQVKNNAFAKAESIETKITKAIDDGNNHNAFLLLFINNIKGCTINVIGGFLLALPTMFNLSFNGFVAADVFVNAYNSGFSICNILKTTLPHSFELIGFWLSGAIGLSIAWKLIQFMRGKDEFDGLFLKKIVKYACIVVAIIICAAYVEAYISVKMI